MSVTVSKKKRIQISLPEKDIELIRRTAIKKKVTVSELISQAVKNEIVTDSDIDRMWSIVAMGEGSNPDASVKHDELIYGR